MKIKQMFVCLLIMLLVPAALAGTVTRTVDNPTPASGETVTVTLTVTAASGDKAIAIHEEAPFPITGLSPSSNVYETVLVDQIQVSSTTKQYQFVAGATGTHYFSGIYQTNGNGVDMSIGGDTSITVGGQCTPGEWTPAASTVCSGQTFTQSNGCNSQQATGTKDCGGGPVCGDGICDTGETCATDCGGGGGTTPDACEFWEKEATDGSCEINTSLIIVAVALLFLLKFAGS